VDAVIRLIPLGFQWVTRDPFLFCVHHDDAYPAGNERMGPAASLAGRDIGMDFEGKDGWRMYHGQVVPGFPQHPHRGFETVTIVRRGLLDHSDSLGAAARFGHGDVQWLTAGRGILHSEMFPLLDPARPNPVELFQIWVNLPKVDKLVDPHFSMLWSKTIPKVVAKDGAGRATEIGVIAGSVGKEKAPAPPPKSWAAQPDSDFAIWTLKMAPGAKWKLPAAKMGTNRTLYFFTGEELRLADRTIPKKHGVELRPDVDASLENGAVEAELLLLQGRPIAEPVAHYGPFVMNTQEEIRQTMLEYQRTQFGGWPWKSDEPVHAREEGRFARHPGGRVEKPV
jgi:redox-sensitive bicupin YhaK (pirin superfamily)